MSNVVLHFVKCSLRGPVLSKKINQNIDKRFRGKISNRTKYNICSRAHLESTLSKHTQRQLSLSQLLDTIWYTGGVGIGTLTHLSEVNLQFLSISSSLRIQNRVRGKMREEVEFQGILRRPHLPPAPGYAREAPPPPQERERRHNTREIERSLLLAGQNPRLEVGIRSILFLCFSQGLV